MVPYFKEDKTAQKGFALAQVYPAGKWQKQRLNLGLSIQNNKFSGCPWQSSG